jgi:hypothetical protein
MQLLHHIRISRAPSRFVLKSYRLCDCHVAIGVILEKKALVVPDYIHELSFAVRGKYSIDVAHKWGY